MTAKPRPVDESVDVIGFRLKAASGRILATSRVQCRCQDSSGFAGQRGERMARSSHPQMYCFEHSMAQLEHYDRRPEVLVLHEFIAINRDEIISRCRANVATRSMPPPIEAVDHGVPVFLDQVTEALRLGLPTSPEIGKSAI